LATSISLVGGVFLISPPPPPPSIFCTEILSQALENEDAVVVKSLYLLTTP
jgi:hypothetical protein